MNLLLDDFRLPTGQSARGIPNDARNVQVEHTGMPVYLDPRSDPRNPVREPEHDRSQRAAQIVWQQAGASTYFQSNWTAAGQGINITTYQTLDMRLTRLDTVLAGFLPPTNNVTNFRVQLAHADGSFSAPISINRYVELREVAVGTRGDIDVPGSGRYHLILQTARIPLTDFANSKLDQVRGVRLVFDDTPRGAIYLANMLFSNRLGQGMSTGGDNLPNTPPAGLPPLQPLLAEADHASRTILDPETSASDLAPRVSPAQGANRIYLPLVSRADPSGQNIVLDFYSPGGFPVRNAEVVLRIGDREFFFG
ncbi:MAG: hypothetical protein MUD01_11605, partial [Chloroflexaceae bacterium]|nr:hypothetical protein [Chloroflexaceae bacterium]